MLLRPIPDRRKATHKGVAAYSLIQILDMHHLESRLLHLMLRVEVRVRRQARSRDHLHDRRMCKPSPPLRVVVDIDLHLAHSARKLVTDRRVFVVETAQVPSDCSAPGTCAHLEQTPCDSCYETRSPVSGSHARICPVPPANSSAPTLHGPPPGRIRRPATCQFLSASIFTPRPVYEMNCAAPN